MKYNECKIEILAPETAYFKKQANTSAVAVLPQQTYLLGIGKEGRRGEEAMLQSPISGEQECEERRNVKVCQRPPILGLGLR